MLGQMTMFAPDASLPLRQRVSVELITAAEARYTLEKFHYLHRARTGRQLNYAVSIDGTVDGVITYALPMVIGSIAGISTLEIIEFARLYLAQNIPHSATCAIGKSLKRIRADWARAFPSAPLPLAVVSWSDTTYHKGTIYKAANFEFLHRSKPTQKGKGAWPRSVIRSDFEHTKDCWIYRWNRGQQ